MTRKDYILIADAIGRTADGIPYYIHRLAAEMEDRQDRPWSADRVPVLLSDLIRDPRNPLTLDHYRDRIATYYPDRADQEGVLAILDLLSGTDSGLPRGTLLERLEALRPKLQLTRDRTVELLELLEKDHYLCRGDGGTAFASGILREWWNHAREGAKRA